MTTVDDDELVPVFIPALVLLLHDAERTKGGPLDEDEVLAVRDNGTCIMLRRSAADAMAESRGYPDLDPESCWEQWQVVRAQLGGVDSPGEGQQS